MQLFKVHASGRYRNRPRPELCAANSPTHAAEITQEAWHDFNFDCEHFVVYEFMVPEKHGLITELPHTNHHVSLSLEAVS